MLLPQKKEREYRFKLALRMGLPIFALVLALISNTLITTYESLNSAFYFEAIVLLAFSIYFIFYIIYSGFNVRITEEVTKTFTREYLYEYLQKEIRKNKDMTLMLISIDNLDDINNLYGIKNGDKVLYKVAIWIEEYLTDKNIHNFPIGHIKGGDFIIGLVGDKSKYKPILDLLCLKSDDFKVDTIEVKISAAINDTSFSNQIEYLVENLFELQNENKNLKSSSKDEEINPNELESFIIKAIKDKNFILSTQDVFEKDKLTIKECFVKLKTPQNKILHQKNYMKVVNRLGLMLDYDLMVLEESIRNCIHTCEEIIAVTISPTSLRNHQFLSKVKELLHNNQNIKNRLMFILWETEYYSHINKYNAILKILRGMGVLIAIDRLGAIHTSFLYLRDLEIDVVRFDSFYVKEITKRDYESIIDGFNVMAHNKNMKTWIKMLEEEEIKALTEKIGIDYLQGKYLAPLEKIYES